LALVIGNDMTNRKLDSDFPSVHKLTDARKTQGRHAAHMQRVTWKKIEHSNVLISLLTFAQFRDLEVHKTEAEFSSLFDRKIQFITLA
jgi:hypothetical protein